MGVIVLAVPPIEVPEVFQEAAKIWFGTKVEWVGWDGSRWTLTDPTQGVFVTPGGVEGFGPPEYVEWVQESPAVAGQLFRGTKAKARQLFFPTAIYSNLGSLAWGELQSAFFHTIKTDRYGTVRVTTPAGQTRTIEARSNAKPFTLNRDPFKIGFQGYGMSLVADQPFWAGDPVSEVFSSGTSSDFFGGSAGPPFVINPGFTFANAKISNSGDVDAWPVWTVVGGAATSATLGVGGEVVEVPFTVAAGKALQIDTDPRVQEALYGDWNAATQTLSNPVDRTGDLGAVGFAPVPPGAEVPLAVALSGTGAVGVKLTPLYERAW